MLGDPIIDWGRMGAPKGGEEGQGGGRGRRSASALSPSAPGGEKFGDSALGAKEENRSSVEKIDEAIKNRNVSINIRL